jgi:pyruvate ferredoxin oxidoreductase beta subunit
MATLKELAKKIPERLSGGHRLCAGCGASIIVRQVLLACDYPVVCTNATGCLEVSTTIYPYSAWRCSWMHNAFENAAATASGIEAALKALKKKGKIKDDFRIIAFGGDGGTYDIGLQSLSGAMERGHRMLYICYDNEAYMNTGVQRSGSTPRGANTTTSPAGKVSYGKKEYPKDLTGIMVAHRIPYVAQTTAANWGDLHRKVAYAMEVDGPSFINIIQPCQLGWKYPMHLTIEMSRLATQTCFWPLYEVIDGKWKLNYDPKDRKIPVVEWMKPQGRFKHLMNNQPILDEIQAEVDRRWDELKAKCGAE